MFGVDIIGEMGRLLGCSHDFLIPGPVLLELKRLSERGTPKERMAAKLGLRLAKRGSVLKSEGGADDAIFGFAVAKKCMVGTTDAALRKKLRRSGISVIYLSSKSHLALNGQIG
jgi:rRNA-processing protein FCF1